MRDGRIGYSVLLGLLVIAGLALAALPVFWRLDALAGEMVPGGEKIFVSAANIPLMPNDRDATKVGKLRYMGGLFITSTDRRFGGLSGLAVSDDGKSLLAVSDHAFWLTARLAYSAGTLSGFGDAVLAPILDGLGKPLRAPYADAESVASLGSFPLDGANGAVDVGFETRDRVERFALGRDGFMAKSTSVAMPEALLKSAANKGLESLVRLLDGRLLAITEHTLDAHGNMIGWIVAADGGSQALSLKRDAPFDLSDIALAPDGALYALERRYTKVAGPGFRIRRIPADMVRAGAILDGEVIADLDLDYSIDNMEGLFVRRSESGKQLFYVLSDDNYSAAQRTLLLMFALEE